MNKDAFRLGLSTGSSLGVPEGIFEAYAEAGICAMEVSLDKDYYENIPWDDICRSAEENGVELWSLHLPFHPFEKIDVSSTDSAIREYTVAYFSDLIRQAAAADIKTIVIHPSGEPIAEEDRKARMDCAKKSLAKLAEVAAQCGAVIAVENLPRTCLGRDAEDILELISADERLRVCFDTNHLLSQPIKEFIEKVNSKIITIHVSDYDFKNERHWLPGDGKIDWPECVAALKSVGYEGPFMYELRLVPRDNIKRRVLTYHDFKENYECLMRGEQPAPIGTPVEEKCTHWKEVQ